MRSLLPLFTLGFLTLPAVPTCVSEPEEWVCGAKGSGDGRGDPLVKGLPRFRAGPFPRLRHRAALAWERQAFYLCLRV